MRAKCPEGDGRKQGILSSRRLDDGSSWTLLKGSILAWP